MRKYIFFCGLVTVLSLFNGCQTELKRSDIFFQDLQNGVLLGIKTSDYCEAVELSLCSGGYLPSFSYTLDNEGRIFLLDVKQTRLDILDKSGELIALVDLSKYFDKLSGKRGSGNIYFDGKDSIYIDLSAVLTTDTYFLLLKYSINSQSVSEVSDRNAFKQSYIASYKNPDALSLKSVFLIPQEDGTVEVLDATSLREEGAILLGASKDNIYYLSNAYQKDGSSPNLVKALKTFEEVESIEVQSPYQTESAEATEEFPLIWEDIYVSEAGDVYISFIDTKNSLWYIKKYSFKE